MTNTHALWIAGIVVAAAAVWFASKGAPATVSNDGALAASSPPPQLLFSNPNTTFTIRPPTPYRSGVLLPGGTNYVR